MTVAGVISTVISEKRRTRIIQDRRNGLGATQSTSGESARQTGSGGV